MSKIEYLSWMAKNTVTQWCNDSGSDAGFGCRFGERRHRLHVERAAHLRGADRRSRSFTWTAWPPFRRPRKATIASSNCSASLCATSLAVCAISMRRAARPTASFVAKSSRRSPAMAPRCSAKARRSPDWGDNVMVKIRGTFSGVQVLEELAAAGVPQLRPCAFPFPRFSRRRRPTSAAAHAPKAAGLTPAPSTAALVMGRLQDYLAAINLERNAGLSPFDLETAALAVVKRCYATMKSRGYVQLLMPAAFRAPRQVAELVGAVAHMTIHRNSGCDREGRCGRRHQAQDRHRRSGRRGRRRARRQGAAQLRPRVRTRGAPTGGLRRFWRDGEDAGRLRQVRLAEAPDALRVSAVIREVSYGVAISQEVLGEGAPRPFSGRDR